MIKPSVIRKGEYFSLLVIQVCVAQKGVILKLFWSGEGHVGFVGTNHFGQK